MQRPNPSSRQDDIPRHIAYLMEHGSSPEAQAARVLQRFMCCKAGEQLVEHGLLRPFGYSLEPGRVVAQQRELRDIIERFELTVACEAQDLHDGRDPDRAADQLAHACQHARERLKRVEGI